VWGSRILRLRKAGRQRDDADETTARPRFAPYLGVGRTSEGELVIIPREAVEATWKDVATFSGARGRAEMERLGREQPDLLAYVLGSTEDLSAPVHALGAYLFLVIWQIFRRSTARRIPRIKAGAIERRVNEAEQQIAKLEGADEHFLERTARVHVSRQPEVFRYMVEAIMEAPDDADDPVPMSPEETGTLFLVLTTAIQALDEACERAG
jgi:hypothetical protein